MLYISAKKIVYKSNYSTIYYMLMKKIEIFFLSQDKFIEKIRVNLSVLIN